MIFIAAGCSVPSPYKITKTVVKGGIGAAAGSYSLSVGSARMAYRILFPECLVCNTA